jgi:hypothetical protein
MEVIAFDTVTGGPAGVGRCAGRAPESAASGVSVATPTAPAAATRATRAATPANAKLRRERFGELARGEGVGGLGLGEVADSSEEG